MTDRVQSLLTETAQGRLATLRPTTDPVSRVAQAVHRSRRRRQGVAAVSAAASIVLVLLLAVMVVPRLTADPVLPGQEFPDVLRMVQMSGHTWPVAGGLARDASFVKAVESRIAQLAGARAGDCKGGLAPHLLFADDILERRIVVARNAAGCWWVGFGRAGVEVQHLIIGDSIGHGPGSPAAMAVQVAGPDGAVSLLVIAPEGAEADLSTRPATWPTLRQTYRPLELGQGVTIAVLARQVSDAVNTAWVNVRTGASSEDRQPTLARTIPALHWDSDHEGQFDALSSVLAEQPPNMQLVTRTALAQAVTHGRFRSGQGPVAVSVVAGGGSSLVVVDVIQDGIRSRVLSTGRTVETSQVLLSDSSQVDPRPVVGLGGPSPADCDAWLPAGTTLHYHLASVAGSRSATANSLGLVYGLPCLSGDLRLDAVTDADGAVVWRADPRDSGVQPTDGSVLSD